MTHRPGSPEDEIDALGRSLRSAVKIQGILRGESPRTVSGGAPPPVSRPTTPPPPATAPPPDAPAPAARVKGPGPAGKKDLFVAAPEHPWQGDPQDSASLGELHDAFQGCLRCSLGESRTKFVFGVGNPNARVLFVGEAPGRDEDLQGEPFVGRAGKLLDKILDAIGWTREDVYIANILKCRPPGNRNPESAEIAACEPILRRQIEIISPVILCTLGSIAAKTLLGTTQGITKLRGTLHEYRGRPVVVTYHPAALLRNPNWKRPTWEDIQLLRKEHDRLVGEAPA